MTLRDVYSILIPDEEVVEYRRIKRAVDGRNEIQRRNFENLMKASPADILKIGK